MGLDLEYFGKSNSKIQFSAMAHHYGWEGAYLQLYIWMMVNVEEVKFPVVRITKGGGGNIPSS